MLLGGSRILASMQPDSFKAESGGDALAFAAAPPGQEPQPPPPPLHDRLVGRLASTPTNGMPGGEGDDGKQQIGSLVMVPPGKSSGGAGGAKSKTVHYRECLKNHAASIGGHALDGCGEFMPCGEEGTMEALKCAACDCHRNFHKREVEGEPLVCDICHMNRRERNRKAAAIAAGVLQQQQQQQGGGHTPSALQTTCNTAAATASALPLAASSAASLGPRTGNAPMSLLALSSRGEGDHHDMSPLSMKKRFRTKFSMDQKEKMYMFAEKVGWRIQKHDEAAVQHFCAEVGVKRHVLKVWMHNNKHTFGKRSSLGSPSSSSIGGANVPPGPGSGAGGGAAAPPPPPPHDMQQHHHHHHLLSDPASVLSPSPLHQHQQQP
ncbi:zinc-finger homeodomain protein 1-like [Selaginella moellendorffii]|nr:zinc-finger homeodomain protein 1-like [Selaginella moellendorffii]|eukprot:XP_024543281.1 zinc-finger homeodomain protein 1-like [Selaginella moellendorffii]